MPEPISFIGNTIKAISALRRPKIAVTLLAICATLLALALWVPELSKYKLGLMVGAVFAGVVLIVDIGDKAQRSIRLRIGSARTRRDTARRLVGLTVEEKHLLQRGMIGLIEMTWDDPGAQELLSRGILDKRGGTGLLSYYSIQEAAANYIREHPQVIATPDNLKPNPRGSGWTTH